MLLLTSADVEQVLTMPECISALKEAYRELGQGLAKNRPRSEIYIPLEAQDTFYRLKTMEGAVPGPKAAALRLNSDFVRGRVVNGARKSELLPVEPGKRWGLILLFSMETCELLAMIYDGYLQKMRVGGTSGLGADYLARRDAATLGLIGSGWQASAQVLAACAIRPISRIRVYSPTRERRETFAREMSLKAGVEIEPVEDRRAAVEGADILLCATNSGEPVFDGRWVRPGMHVGAIVGGDRTIPRGELDTEILRRADFLLVNSKARIRDGGQRDLLQGLDEGWLSWERIYELPDLVLGNVAGRTAADQITVFKNNVGVGIQFAAVAARTYELARKRGLGRDLPSEWFLETGYWGRGG